MAAGFEAFHGEGLGRNAVGVLLGIERRLEDHIGVAVLGNHNALVSAARADGEAARVVYV